jgi:hypothetical protein
MGPRPAVPEPGEGPGSEGMPAGVRAALAEVAAAVEALNRDQATAITEQAFDRAADLRERAEALRQRKAAILHEWRQAEAGKAAEPVAAPDRGGATAL